jgi:hypothetical protein
MIPVISDPDWPGESALSRQVAEALMSDGWNRLQRLRLASDLLFATDFSRSSSGGTTTVGILIVDLKDLHTWQTLERGRWRQSLRYPEQTVSYKKFRRSENDLRELNRFLSATLSLPGFLVTGTVPTNPCYIFTEKDACHEHPDLVKFRGWKSPTFESLRRLAVFLAPALRPFARPGQNLHWLCDHDDILATDEHRKLSPTFLAGYLSALVGTDRSVALYEPDIAKSRDSRLAVEDVLAIPDVAAGGIGDYLDLNLQFYGSEGIDDPDGQPEPPGMKPKASQVFSWFGHSPGNLRRVALKIDPATSQAILYSIDLHRRPYAPR